VRTVILAVFNQLAGLFKSEAGLTSSMLGITAITLPDVPAQDGSAAT